MAITRHIEHIKSKVVENNSPKLPTASQIHEGEIAVNFAKDYETLSIKNSSGDIVTFSSDKATPTYCANVPLATSQNYIREPEFKTVKINGSTTNAASTENCVLQYDNDNKCVKFIFN